MKNLSRSSKVPLYFQLYEILHEQIKNGAWQPEDMLPTETELVKQYDLSRATVRQAFDMLVNQGWVYRRQGRGTFVARPTFEQNLNRIISFWEDMHQRGLKPGTRVISSEIIPATEEVTEDLQVEPGEELASLMRLRLADDEPLSIEHSLLVHRYCPGILEQDYANNSLRQMLAEQFNIRLTTATQKIRAVPASEDLAELLAVDVNAPLLHLERVSYSDQGTPIEYLRIHLRGDRYTFYTELRD
ncbi:MAG: GntR family transcriptional regulator [Chloroflexi bacterium]|nr:MAG: GntR family transcriptional regulator [Chloroflexota bacterium]MBL1196463.1 GntR family transcriptional regulator [Chloroflexota bacterium]NOH13758.1 GntR family transcriptional regulator [Chloroflexota bacterium]